jgi:hypothetical protein
VGIRTSPEKLDYPVDSGGGDVNLQISDGAWNIRARVHQLESVIAEEEYRGQLLRKLGEL